MILIIYTISLGNYKETNKSIKVGAVKVYDTNLIYSKVIGLQARDRPVDIADNHMNLLVFPLHYSQIVKN